MTPEALASEAIAALQGGTRMTLVRRRGAAKLPPKFPRGELLCENALGDHCWSYDPAKILRWLKKSGLVQLKLTESHDG